MTCPACKKKEIHPPSPWYWSSTGERCDAATCYAISHSMADLMLLRDANGDPLTWWLFDFLDVKCDPFGDVECKCSYCKDGWVKLGSGRGKDACWECLEQKEIRDELDELFIEEQLRQINSWPELCLECRERMREQAYFDCKKHRAYVDQMIGVSTEEQDKLLEDEMDC